ncbi:MAG: hypothetical protein COX70_05000 [Flavobacteriales bacterium CG_4_10_14_0_2_um_filter_32_8]|nr:MAG: hypothetical protein COX70_05000 [Flavobacteriales bacterium CG_4_10_14_0_2_um_filter_32_8]PJB14597.1 MAG: hypothetical protein CO118_07715 [Flavobacteriales bacterium CG_4_9_14_3_um_filter_32_8]
MIFANTDKEITIIYYSEDHIGRQILTYAQSKGLPIHDIDLAHVKLTSLHWAELAGRLNIKIKDLINVEAPSFLQKFNGLTNLSEIDWLSLLEHNPDILRAPIVMKGDKIVMMSNPQDMLYFV